jgi:choice-of-anchor C domain-containing protein
MLTADRFRLPSLLLRTASLILTLVLGPWPGWSRAMADDPPAKAEKKLLIVAVRAEHDILAPFLAHKKKLLPTELVSLEEILKGTKGADDAEKLKRYLYDRWKKDHVGYVLLAGGVEVIPVRYAKGTNPSPDPGEWPYLPSDLYYADLAKQDGSFENWNGRSDGLHAGYFGEVTGWDGKDPINADEIDYLPEVAVGRWPIHDRAQLQSVVTKTIRYENHVLADDLPAVRRLAFVNGPNLVDARPSMTAWADRLASVTGNRPVRLLYKDGGRDDGTPPPDQTEVERVLNGGVGMIFHVGHGSETSWDGCLDLAELRKIRNTAFAPVMFSIGCTTARYAPLPPGGPYQDATGKVQRGMDAGGRFAGPAPPPGNYQRGVPYQTGLGVEFLRAGSNGAVAYIGCAVGANACSWGLMDGFAGYYLSHEEPRIGDAWMAALAHYHQAYNLKGLKAKDWFQVAIFAQGMEYHLFGDPSLKLPRSVNPANNLLVNGSFEDGPAVGAFLPLDEGSTAIPGWTVIGGQIDYLETHWKASDGLRSLDLHGSPGYGGVAQAFDTVKGRRYRLTFALSSSGDNPIIKRVGVAAAGKRTEFAVDATGKTFEDMGWEKKSWEFEAVSDRTMLEIYTMEQTDPVAGPALDDVKVVVLPDKK